MARLSRFLSGIRVLDLSRHLPGPFVTLLMADMGADVLKIEPPDGDELRTMGPIGPDGHSLYFSAVNAGKTTRRMDLKDGAARAEFLGLVAKSDVLVESFRPGVVERLGIDYGTLKTINPGLVYCSLNGFGRSGPLAQTPGHDINYLALAGALGHNQSPFDPPIADCAGALFACITILGALHARAADLQGCHIDAALGDAIMPLQLFQLSELAASKVSPQPRSSLLNGAAACYQIYETCDGRRVSLGALETKFWRAFCAAANRPDWEARHNEPFPQKALTAEVAALFAGLTQAECNERFLSANCCYAPVLDLAEAIASLHVRDRRIVHVTADGSLQGLFPVYVDGEAPPERPPLREDRPHDATGPTERRR